MPTYLNTDNLKNSVSPYDKYCDGYGNTGASGNSYILGLVIGVGKTDITFSHPGSQVLDEINAFDLAEIDGPYIGQLNMSVVSSFCGPQGLIWGYDIAHHEHFSKHSLEEDSAGIIKFDGGHIRVHDANMLIDATKRLFGSVDSKRFVIRPGAHVPFAGKNKIINDQGTIYAAIALGIPKDRKNDACLLMEDIGMLKSPTFSTDEKTIVDNLAKSILKIGQNQRVKYADCFVAIKTCEVGGGEIGCALVAAPYFTLAKNAITKDNKGNMDYQKMFELSLNRWEKDIF